MKIKRFKNISEIQTHIKGGEPTLYCGSRTSTVLPFEKMEVEKAEPLLDLLKTKVIGDLSQLPKEISLTPEGELLIRGAVTWKEAKEFARSKNLNLKTSPTEELALCLSGIATSCTGERSFAYGAVKDQISKVHFIDFQGEIMLLEKRQSFAALLDATSETRNMWQLYQQSYRAFEKFKNAPFPRFEFATDLMAGTEGQLGVITEAVFQTVPWENEMYLLLKLPAWDKNFDIHLEVFKAVQAFRGVIEACEFMDHNSLSHLPEGRSPVENSDLLFLQFGESQFDRIYEELVTKIPSLNQDSVFEMSAQKCRELRMDVPRYVFESNTRNGVVKVGTDVQVLPHQFEKLLLRYKKLSQAGLPCNLFGHFGDAHLHFNLMPTQKQLGLAKSLMHEFYGDLQDLGVSPFAEHGIGLLKLDYIRPYYKAPQRELFNYLKNKFDPNKVFFPDAFMSQGEDRFYGKH